MSGSFGFIFSIQALLNRTKGVDQPPSKEVVKAGSAEISGSRLKFCLDFGRIPNSIPIGVVGAYRSI